MSLEQLIRALGGVDTASPAVAAWLRATEALGADADTLERLAFAWRWRHALDDPNADVERLRAADVIRHMGAAAFASLRGEHGANAMQWIAVREATLTRLAALPDRSLPDELAASTAHACALLDALRDPTSQLAHRVRRALPELAALAHPAAGHDAVEHEPCIGDASHRLLDHVSVRALGRKLAGLEAADRRLFQRDDALSPAAFAAEVALTRRLGDLGLLPCVRVALAHLDFAKGGTPDDRRRWQDQLGADLTVHNEAAAVVLDHAALASRFGALSPRDGMLARLVVALVRSHGLCGQLVRGETSLALLAPFVGFLRSEAAPLAAHLGCSTEDAVDVAVDCLHLVNLCDTAGVREGLLNDELRAELGAVESMLRHDGRSESAPMPAIERGLARRASARWHALPEGPARTRARLGDRLRRLRAGRLRHGEPETELEAAVNALGDHALEALGRRFEPCQLWYAEAATAILSPTAQLKLLALALRAADASPHIDADALWHLSLEPLVAKLHPGANEAAHYRARLLETLLVPHTVDDLLSGPTERALDLLTATDAGLGAFETRIGNAGAMVLDFIDSDETAALLTLLPIYERKSSAAFHATLKSLCDLYELRKDEFDRLANEATYIVNMNAARSDKQRMLDYVVPGNIIEVGPGGGVVLDLLAERFTTSRIVCIDVSSVVVQTLRSRAATEGRPWTVIEADAFDLPDHVGAGTATTVVFCSVLHEIFSYVAWPRDADDGARFRVESVRDMVRAAYRSLAPGGRIVIRDGVAPQPATRRIRFLAEGGRDAFALFCDQFEARTIAFTQLARDRVELSAADAMEFLYTYTWGPASFPYEVREQYGVMTYDDYQAAVLAWLSDQPVPAQVVPVPRAMASYLQPGYVTHLADKIALTDEADVHAALPDSNCLLVFEKPA